jgi:hypothetical protein
MPLPTVCRLLFAALLCVMPNHGWTQSSARERVDDPATLRGLFADRTFYGRYANATDWVEYYAPDGRLAYWDGCPHAGRWWIENAEACFHYPTMVGGNTFCFDVYRGAPGSGRDLEFLTPGSNPDWIAAAFTRNILAGNVENMSLTASGCQVSRLQMTIRERTP